MKVVYIYSVQDDDNICTYYECSENITAGFSTASDLQVHMKILDIRYLILRHIIHINT